METTVSKQLTADQAVKFIQSRTNVSEPGKYNLQVISVNPYEDRIIVGLKAQSSTGLAKAKEALRAGNYSEAANTNMSTSLFADAKFVPAKGEHVACMVDYVENREGHMVLGVVSVSEIKARNTSKVSLGDEFANLLDANVATESNAPALD
jgi:hypothetical protein